jgi:hypothetical protein
MPAAKRKAPAKPKPAKPAQPWERLDGEPDRAFEAFRLYLEQGPARSTGKVGESLGHRSSKQSERWSSRWQWRRRVAAFDQAAAATSDTAHLDAVAKRSKRQAELAQLQGEALALPTVELLRRARQDPSVLQKLGLEDLVRLAAQAARAYPRVIQAERLALGVSTDAPAAPAYTPAQEKAQRMPDEQLDAELMGVDPGVVVPIGRGRRRPPVDRA